MITSTFHEQLKAKLSADTQGFIAAPEINLSDISFDQKLTLCSKNKEIVSGEFSTLSLDPRISAYISWRPELFQENDSRSLLVYVPENCTVAQPFIITSTATAACAIEKVIIILGKNARAVGIMRSDYTESQTTSLDCQIIADENAHCSLYITSDDSAWSKKEITLHLRQKGARIELYGMATLADAQKAAIITKQNHYAAHTQSSVVIKSVLADAAHFFCSGLISVEQGAQNSFACQQNKNMILHQQARCQSVPRLQVKTNEVKCVHGTATGPLDQQLLLYMSSRGLSESQARHMLVRGFIEEVYAGLPESLHEPLVDRMLKKISKDAHE